MGPEGYTQFDLVKMQLLTQLNATANSMRECATTFDTFAQIVGSIPYGNPLSLPAIPNGQFSMQPIQPMVAAQEENGKKRKSRGDDADGKRRQKKPRDPNAPKRPASSYLLFQNDVRNELKAQHPELRNNELLSAIAKRWAEMPQSEKDEYEARNRAAKDTWLAQKKVYEAGKAGTSAIPEVMVAPAKLQVSAPTAESAEAEDDSDEEDEENSEEGDSFEEDGTTAPPPKKNKKEETPVKESKKEKKPKKSKA